MTSLTIISLQVSAQNNKARPAIVDRIAIKDLIDSYSHDADRRLAHQQAMLFTKDAVIEIYNAEPETGTKPEARILSRDSLEKAFGVLKKYDVTMHFNGQSTIKLNGDRATGEVYCLAHHIWKVNGKRMLMVKAIRYYDDYVFQDGSWLFKKRKLIFDFTDVRETNSVEPEWNPITRVS